MEVKKVKLKVTKEKMEIKETEWTEKGVEGIELRKTIQWKELNKNETERKTSKMKFVNIFRLLWK